MIYKIKKIFLTCFVLVLIGLTLPLHTEAASIKLSKSKATIYVGSSLKLKMKGTSKKVSWRSSRKKIAAVNSKGTVTAKKAGTATITAKVNKKSYKCKITVKNPYLNKTAVTINKGETFKLKITGTAAKSWKSSNKKVATVDSKGKVSAKREGTAIITCKGKNGKSYKCTVYVHEHQYTSQVTKEPDCEQKGVRTYTCICGAKYTEAIPALGHDYSNTEIVAPTKKGQGYTLHSCTRCSESYKDAYTDYNPDPQQVYQDMVALQTSYPEGMSWTNDNYYAWSGGIYSGGYGCAGFAFLLSDEAFGYLPARMHTDFTNIKVGDILRVNNDTHSVIVLEVQTDSVVVAEGNFNDSIHWGREITISFIQATGSYVMTRYPS